MATMRWFRRLRALLDPRRLDAELDEELRFHLDAQIDERVAAGMTPDEARRTALRDFGGVAQVRECHREARGVPALEVLVQDLRFGLRLMRRSPGFTATAIATLALGIGATTAIFTVIHAVAIKPLPYPNPDELVAIWTLSASRDGSLRRSQFVNGTWMRDLATAGSFQQTAQYRIWRFAHTGPFEAERVEAALVSRSFFETLGVQPAVGRGFTGPETAEGAAGAVVISDEFRRQWFGGTESALGQDVELDGVSYTVVGVMPPGFELQLPGVWQRPAVYVPLAAQSAIDPESPVSGNALGRLRGGVTLAAAAEELNGIYRGLDPARSAELTRVADEVGRDVRPALWVLLGATGCVLLIGCVNLANLLLARGAARQSEMSLRRVLGAGRWRLGRQALTETLALAIAGGAAGLVLSNWLVRLIVLLYPGSLPRVTEAGPEPAVFAFAFLLSLVTGGLVALAPLAGLGKIDLHGALKRAPDARSGGGPSNWARQCLVAVELALTIVLLAGAGLLLDSFLRLTGVDPQFRRDNLALVDVALPPESYPSAETQAAFAERLLERVESLPGILDAGVTNSPPLIPNYLISSEFRIAGHPEPEPAPVAGVRAVSPLYLEAMGTPLVEGRRLETDETDTAVLVNQSFASRFLDGENPVGEEIILSGQVRRIVGVVADVKNRNLDEATDAEIYIPFPSMPAPFFSLAIHSGLAPDRLDAMLREQLRSLDSAIPLGSVSSVEEVLGREVAEPRFRAAMVGLFGVLAAVLAAVGVWGVVAYGVAQRRHEIGVRMALGARGADVVGRIAARGMAAPLAGIVLGIAGAAGVTPLLRSMLFDVEPHDPVVYTAAAAGMLAVLVLATVLPALGALRVDPAELLRQD